MIFAVVLTAVLGLITSCTSSSGTDPSSPAVSTPITSSPSGSPTGGSTSSTPPTPPFSTTETTPTTEPSKSRRAAAAKAAYLAFVAATFRVERHPAKPGKPLQRYAIDPALGKEQSTLTEFQLKNIEWRGTPPTPRPRITKMAFSAQPYPQVTLVDCQKVSHTWRPYSTKTGKPLKLVKPKVPPPWAITVTVAFYKGSWMVQTKKTDMTRTCRP